MKGYLKVIMSLLLPVLLMTQCSKKGRVINEPRFGLYNFSTYTVDSFRFRVILNGETLTDSLLSPVGFFSRAISFFNTDGKLQIIDIKNNNQLVIDTTIELRTGSNTFSLVQLQEGQKPFIPPPPNEPPPAPGKYKVRFQYSSFIGDENIPPQPFFYDSVRCYIRLNGVNIDTVVLGKYELSPFYEGGTGGVATFSIQIRNALNGNLIDASTSPSIGGAYAGFNTVSVSGRTTLNDWILIRMY